MGMGKTARNAITGDEIKTKVASQKYKDNYDRIFNKNNSDNSDKSIKKSENKKE